VTWRIVHADVRSGLPGIEADGGSAYVVFWWGALPLGARSFAPEELPLGRDQVLGLTARWAAEQLACRIGAFGGTPAAGSQGRPVFAPPLDAVCGPLGVAEALDALAEPPDALEASDLSVVVCTRDRPEALAGCLAALARQRSPAGEVVVVDNSADGTAAAVVAGFAGVRHVHEPRPGLSVARNTGVLACTRPLVAFTDDDVEVSGTWTAELVRAFALAPEADAVTGLVLPASLDSAAQRLFQFQLGGFGSCMVPVRFDARFLDDAARRGPQVWRIGAGANMAFRQGVFDRVGLFDERLGAGAAGCSEDSELWYRILAAGGTCLYEPRAVVHHHHRADLAGLAGQMRAYMRGHVAALVAQHDRCQHPGNLRRIALHLPRYFARTAVHALGADSPDRARLLAEEVRGWLGGIGLAFRPAWRRQSEAQIRRPAPAKSAAPAKEG